MIGNTRRRAVDLISVRELLLSSHDGGRRWSVDEGGISSATAVPETGNSQRGIPIGLCTCHRLRPPRYLQNPIGLTARVCLVRLVRPERLANDEVNSLGESGAVERPSVDGGLFVDVSAFRG